MAADVPDVELADYQRAVRNVLRHPLISEHYPDQRALPLVRRWHSTLRIDLAEAFGYRLELSGTAARLVRTADDLDPAQPARTRTGREFDRRRYGYLALVLAALGRAGIQVALSELADVVAADANRIDGLGLDTGRGPHRAAFVDVVTWLEDRGALRLADGSARAWADDPDRSEALYDIDRDVALAVFRPTRVLHHVRTVAALLDRPGAHGPATSRDSARRAAGQRARRVVVERAGVYYAEVDDDTRNMLRTPALAADLTRLTGLAVERRAEGVALVDTAGLAERRFPAGGTVAHAALLLLGEISDRIVDPDAPHLHRLPAPSPAERTRALAAEVDRGLPVSEVLTELTEESPPAPAADAADTGGDAAYPGADAAGTAADGADPDLDAAGTAADAEEPATYPLLEAGWLESTMKALVDRYGAGFGADWRADPPRLLAAAIALLAEHRIVEPVEGGVLALPLLGRYRNVVVAVRRREPTLFDTGEAS
jgi:uncharacterized protein (TIGR02678 family)